MAEVKVKVAVRCRPLNAREKQLDAKVIIDMKDGKTTFITDPQHPKEKPKDFGFDHSYFMDTMQETVYKDLGEPILQKAMDGYNGTIFAYGQTGSGKSFSMTGYNGDYGIIPRMNKDMFEKVAAAPANKEFQITVSYLEIYNEHIHDLLNPTDDDMRVREHPNLGVYVENLAEIVVKSAAEVEKLLEQGNQVRSVAETKMNATSSRSHSIFTVKVAQRDKDDDSQGSVAKINLVDLAGSERQKSTGAEGDRLKEGAAINKSLGVLGRVISILADSKKKNERPPFRESKLTRILQESLGGNTLTVMLAALSPADVNYEETLSTLRYANQAKNIQNVSKRNEDENARLIRELREEVERLRTQLGGGGQVQGQVQGVKDEKAIKDMELAMQQLELVKRQAWEEKEKLSRMYEEERKKNLADRGIMEWVMDTLKQENEELKKKLDALQLEKEKLMKDLTDQKDKVDKLRNNIAKEVSEYSALVKSGALSETEKSERFRHITALKDELKLETEQLNNVKDRLRAVKDQQLAERNNFKDTSQLFGMESEIRKEIAEEERRRAEEETQALLENEKLRLLQELEAEKEALLQHAQHLSHEEQISRDEFIKVEMRLMQEKSDKQLLSLKMDHMQKNIDSLKTDLEMELERMELDREKQELQYFQVFRRYRDVFEEDKRQIEKKYTLLLEQCVADCLQLSSRNVELEQEVRDLRQQLGLRPTGASGSGQSYAQSSAQQSGGGVVGLEPAPAPAVLRAQGTGGADSLNSEATAAFGPTPKSSTSKKPPIGRIQPIPAPQPRTQPQLELR